MNTLSYKTQYAKSSHEEQAWYVADASSATLGRVASHVAAIIRGKHKPGYTPNVICGDNVIVINADKVRMSGKKWDNKIFASYSGYPGGQKLLTPKQIHQKSNIKLVEMAVKGMLPKTRLGSQMFKKLHVYAGSEHPHSAQNPKVLEIK